MHSTFPRHTGQLDRRSLPHALIYLTLAVAVVAASLEFGAAFIILYGICVAIALIVITRLEGIEGRNDSDMEVPASMSRSDGGTFPSAPPEPRVRRREVAIVMDGGSLEHHGSR